MALFKEVRYAWRTLAKNPAFTCVAALSLALGIGANCAIFSFADAILLKPLPVPHPYDLLVLNTPTPSDPYGGVSYTDYRDIRKQVHALNGLAAFRYSTVGFALDAQTVPQVRLGLQVSDNFFRVLDVEPPIGRGLRADEGQIEGRDPVIVLSHHVWQTQFAGDRSAIGRSVRLNGVEFTIIGVAPESFTGVDQWIRPAFFIPLSMAKALSPDAPGFEQRDYRDLMVKARLNRGVSRAQAQSELTAFAKDLERTYPATNRNRGIALSTELQFRMSRDPVDPVLAIALLVLAGLVLLIACANVANLMLARSRARAREIAIRLAIGAGRLQLVRQLMMETLMLAMIAAVLGIAFASGAIQYFRTIQVPSDLPIVIGFELDTRALIFTIGVALASAMFFGSAPAWQAVRTNLVPALKSGNLGTISRHRTIGRNALVIGQVALSMALLTASGMLLDMFRKVLVLDPGFRTDHLLMTEFDTSYTHYTAARTVDFYRKLLDRTKSLPGVRSATLTSNVPLSPEQRTVSLIPQGYELPKGKDTVSAFAYTVGPEYFATMRTAVLRGRGFTANDRDTTRHVIVVNERFAKLYWPKQDPIGKQIRLWDANGALWEVVGVAKLTKVYFVGEPATALIYFPFEQDPRTSMAMLVEAYGDPAAIAAPVREVVRSIDANQPVFNVRTLASFYDARAISIGRTIMTMVSTMGLLGLTLALVGLYGLMAYSVIRRTREIGVRMAIGASRSNVVVMFLQQGFVLIAVGTVIGAVLSFAIARAIASGIESLGAPNPATFVVVPLVLLVTTMAACYIPARRAAEVDPILALRCE